MAPRITRAGVSLEPAKASLATGFRFEDRYEILGELGSGSFGRVYRACQLSTGQSVAIKLLAPREGALGQMSRCDVAGHVPTDSQ